jgi:hypothetical protein
MRIHSEHEKIHIDAHFVWDKILPDVPFPEVFDRWILKAKDIYSRTMHFIKHPPVVPAAERPLENSQNSLDEASPVRPKITWKQRWHNLKNVCLRFMDRFISPVFKNP